MTFIIRAEFPSTAVTLRVQADDVFTAIKRAARDPSAKNAVALEIIRSF